MSEPTQIPVILTVAGSDNSAGAGIQADLKALSALGTYGVTALTCVVAEVPGRVSAIHPLTPELVREQMALLFGAFPISAMKTGMLCSGEIAETVCEFLEAKLPGKEGLRLPVVVDPVMVATSGDPLLTADAVAIYQERLFPLAALVTPNLDEVAALLGSPVQTFAEMQAAGAELVRRYRVPFLVKGGHLRGREAVDLLFYEGRVEEFRAPFFPGISTHGTGCTYSAAIAAGLGRGRALGAAVRDAKALVGRAIAGHLRWRHGGRETDALHHFAGAQLAGRGSMEA